MRFIIGVGVALVLALASPALAQFPATYEMRWVAICGSWGTGFQFTVTATGELRVVVEEFAEGEWQALNESTGELVWLSGDGTLMLPLPPDCSSEHAATQFEWIGMGDDPFQAFTLYNAFGRSANTGDRIHTVGRRVPNQPAATVTITSPTANQTVAGTIPIRVTMTGFTGERQYSLLVDGVQRQFGTTTSNSLTLWFNTTRMADGTHTITVRIVSGSTQAEASVSVVVNN